jgi:hypothetical protein
VPVTAGRFEIQTRAVPQRPSLYPFEYIEELRTCGIAEAMSRPKDLLTIERLRTQRPGMSKLLLDGFQAASFPITGRDFHAVMELLVKAWTRYRSALRHDRKWSDPDREHSQQTERLAVLIAIEQHSK